MLKTFQLNTKNVSLFFSLLASAAVTQEALACPTYPMLGTVCVTSIAYCPQGYAEANGSTLSVSGNEALYSLLGNTYGGNPPSTFGLPDLRARTAIGIGAGPNMTPVVAGQLYGTEKIALTAAQLPAHTHAATFAPGSGAPQGTVSVPVSSTVGTTNTPDASKGYLSQSPSTGAGSAAIWGGSLAQATTIGNATATVNGPVGSVSVGLAGASNPVSIIPPQLGSRYCIATEGIYPPRPQ